LADGFVKVFVEDTGIGVKKEDLQRIFEPFEQAESSLSRRFQGTGWDFRLPGAWWSCMAERSGPRVRGRERRQIFFLIPPDAPQHECGGGSMAEKLKTLIVDDRSQFRYLRRRAQ